MSAFFMAWRQMRPAKLAVGAPARSCRVAAERRGVAGFSLVELFVALAVAGILLAIAIPSFKRLTTTNRLSAAANDIVNAIGSARLEAVKHNATAQFCSNEGSANGTGNYALACAGNPGAVFVDQGGSLVKVTASPPTITAPIKYSGSMTALRFRPDGLAYAATAAAPYTGQVADICSTNTNKDSHRVISIAAGSIVRTVTTNGDCS